MTRIESEKHEINASPEEVFNFLSDLNNYEVLLPQDKISDWESDKTSCSFKVQGSYHIGLLFEKSDEYTDIYLASSEDSPFPFTLRIQIEETGGRTVGGLICEAEINAFLKMMVEKPLSNLFNYMSKKLEEQFSN
jgi:carbon monoxide dehydrogenase subunit G